MDKFSSSGASRSQISTGSPARKHNRISIIRNKSSSGLKKNAKSSFFESDRRSQISGTSEEASSSVTDSDGEDPVGYKEIDKIVIEPTSSDLESSDGGCRSPEIYKRKIKTPKKRQSRNYILPLEVIHQM